MSEQTEERSIGKRANELNALIRYTMWSVFKLVRPLGDEQRSAAADEVTALFDELAGKDVVVRGTYDVSALRADADRGPTSGTCCPTRSGGTC
jgi:chlorite dismutase